MSVEGWQEGSTMGDGEEKSFPLSQWTDYCETCGRTVEPGEAWQHPTLGGHVVASFVNAAG